MDGYIPKKFDLYASFVALMDMVGEDNEIVSASMDKSGRYGNHIEINAVNGNELIEMRVAVSRAKEEQA